MAIGRRQVLGWAMLSASPAAVTAGAAQTPAADKPPSVDKPPSAKTPPLLLLRIEFAAGSTELGPDAKAQLDAAVARIPAPELDRRRVQILGFASGNKELISATRRLSLERTLVVRTYLLEKSVAADRMDVRALGTTVLGEAPQDRVDVYLGTVDVPATRLKPK